MENTLNVVAENLKKRGFEALVFNTKEEAAEYILSEAANIKSVGWGGSESVKSLGIREKLIGAGKEIRDHELVMDLFLLSANALTVDGRIVNIDGRGNRIAASISGPGRVIYVVGNNKIVNGGIDDAIARIKREACPPNCRRLNKKTPCASTGICANCDSADRICKVTVVFDRKPTATPTLVALVNEPLGY